MILFNREHTVKVCDATMFNNVTAAKYKKLLAYQASKEMHGTYQLAYITHFVIVP